MPYPTLRLKDGFASQSPELRDDVKRLQSALIRAGYDLDADGQFGRGTEDAVRVFQRTCGLTADGIAGPKTWQLLEPFMKAPETPHEPDTDDTAGESPVSYPTLRLRDGSASQSPELRDDVERLQNALIRAGYDLDADGQFGRGTGAAVRAFQRTHGQVADGIVGPKTWQTLEPFMKAPETPQKPDADDTAYPALQLKDGFASESPELRDDVKRLQSALILAGYDLDSDGLFGRGTEDAVKAFQRTHGQVADGIVGPKTWQTLEPFMKTPDTPQKPDTNDAADVLPGFHGDLSWVHDREGHAGKTYWPGGASGVTLDPGVDLGHASPSLIEAAYKSLLSAEQYTAVKSVLGIKGQAAKQALRNNATLRSVRISRSQADGIFKYAAKPYWEAIVRRFPTIREQSSPASVQTVMLSLSYNRGAGNRNLNVLSQPIKNKNWLKVADLVGAMQQNHSLAGIRKRRRMEANLIRSELA
ncbi:hypothetical protein DENIS_1869 [Desulfonema ishimotonii]|uniref:Peptidoglycan binding-like domain-containing protein n=1 Tax=Desulfonema ishimotonii TaxID=45657 RepID=A0A401FVB7_9BACT|nr:peptidoglycan-binding protein [Desulfonema ishimotonii]GBC60909.1 hypothetical protein DENIS_1869 [Desulfonema ishimotonii]